MTDNTPYTPTTAEVREAFSEMSSWDMSADEADAAFDRWLDTVRAEVLAEQDTDWEYGTRCPMPECTEPHLLDPNDAPVQPEESLWRRTKAREVPAGEWEPAPITESEEA